MCTFGWHLQPEMHVHRLIILLANRWSVAQRYVYVCLAALIAVTTAAAAAAEENKPKTKIAFRDQYNTNIYGH